ncbi:MAG TPA: glycoside hydrolase family 15 protein [Dehalococcoidia bacterium]|nr:glycoside hydrolase family 15 protein [Dehalococcoidia bacterium]
MTRIGARRYPDIDDYGLIGDSRASALVSLDGSIDWLCLPRFDSPSVFGRLLDWERGGHFRIAPDMPYESRHRYIDDTNVLETTFTTETGIVRLIDFMPAQTEAAKRHALEPLRALYRFVECDLGRVPMHVEYVPRPVYGTGPIQLRTRTHYDITAERDRHVMHLRSDVRLDTSRRDARATFEVVPGERLRFSLAYSFGEPAVILPDNYIDEVYRQTIAFWRAWSAECTYDGPYRREVLRSALVLKLLTYAPSGAIVAAPTTSLPEEIGGERNWDYRYCWTRDSALTVRAFLALGIKREAHAYMGWLLHATNLTKPKLDPLYTIYGEAHIPERELTHFEGYRGSSPVRIGNGAFDQRQLDVYGELIDAAHSYLEEDRRTIRHDEAALVAQVANYVAKIWREPDNGIWEPRVPPRHYVHSKVMAWDALTHAAMLARDGRIPGDADRWQREADEVREMIMTRGYNERIGSFTQVLDGEHVDASLLQLPLVGFIAGHDPRMVSTIDVIREQLDIEGFVMRYRNEDGLQGEEGAFLACSFWLAAALASAGRVGEAEETFEHTMRAANELGLLPEEYNPVSGTALGNFPQGLSHIALITAALAIAGAERGEIPHGRAWPLAK